MKRYIITKEQIKGQEYIISALYDENRRMLEVNPEPKEARSLLGNIYIGKVQKIVKNINAAFISIGTGQSCYYSLEDYKNPVFIKKSSANKKLVAGDELLVQVSKEALKTKDPSVTTNLNFTGKYAVLTTENTHLGISTKLPKDKRDHYMELLKGLGDRLYGIIVRTNAAEVLDQELLDEISELETQYQSLIEKARYRTCYSCLYEEPSFYLKNLKDLRLEELEEIITDDRGIFEEICDSFRIPVADRMSQGSVSLPVNLLEAGNQIKIRYYEDCLLSLSSLYSVKPGIDAALKERVWLKSGAYLIIQPTEALTVIDVNSGKNIAKKNAGENFLRINKEAAVEIAHQLRLRNISGMILVDFVNLKSREAEAELMAEFRKELKKDPIPAKLIDITKLGLVEVTRKKVKKPLLEMIQG